MVTNERRFQLMILLCQTFGICNINSIPSIALSHGAAGCIIFFFVFYLLLGIPLLYMELIIGQFTGRDCVDVWKICPFLSYTGYVLIAWQVIILLYNHTYVSFAVHYFLISFENPIPYYECGPWSSEDCNILNNNYTVNEDCIRHNSLAYYCEDVQSTFPEFQYWRHHVLRINNSSEYFIAWRICLASGLVSIFLYLSCFKRKNSMKWVVSFLPIYPLLGFVIIMMGTMLQKGLVAKFDEALDLEFIDFTKKFRLSNIIQQITYNLGLGSGVTLNFASSTSFRSNCFSNSIVSVVICTVFSILAISTTAMIGCPYAYQFGMSSGIIIKSQMSLAFEKIPRLLSQFQHRVFWLILIYSCYVALGLCTNILVSYNLLETIFVRNKKIAKYPGLTCFGITIIIFLVTIPLLSNAGITFALSFRRYMTLMSTFVVLIECIVFIICYGLHKFSEDVHFMLGIQPSFYMRIAWSLASGLLAYTICGELIYYFRLYPKNSVLLVDLIGWCVLFCLCGIIVLLCVGKLLIGVFRKRFLKQIKFDPNWGPRSDILLRSRAMFSAQAMTKEYMYRQYHLQAGITSRQRISNKRNVNEIEDQQYPLCT